MSIGPVFRLLVLNGWLALLADQALGGGPDLLSYRHENLRSGQQESLESLRGQAGLLVFFEPDCTWCMKQIRVLDELLEACPGQLGAAALGVHGNRLELRQELRRLRPSFPAFMAGQQIRDELDGVRATPMMLLAGLDGGFLEVFTGYLPRERLQVELALRLGLDCLAGELPTTAGKG